MIPSPLDAQSPQALLDSLSTAGLELVLEPTLPAAQMEAMYRRVWQAIQAGDPAAAVDEAFILASNDPWERDYLLALAHCLHHQGDYEQAGHFYGLAFLLDATDALCAYRIGECLGALEEFPEAREAFDAAVRLSWLDPGYAEVRDYAQQRLDELTSLGV